MLLVLHEANVLPVSTNKPDTQFLILVYAIIKMLLLKAPTKDFTQHVIIFDSDGVGASRMLHHNAVDGRDSVVFGTSVLIIVYSDCDGRP